MPDGETGLKPYSPPRLNKLTLVQAKLLLLGQAGQGDQGAKDLLEVIFQDPNSHQERVSPRIEGGNAGRFSDPKRSRASRLILRARMIRESVWQDFRRFVRG